MRQLLTLGYKIIFPMKLSLPLLVGLFAAGVAFAAPALSEVRVVFGPNEFSAGDSIVIEQVLSTSRKLQIGDQVVVRGRYTLGSRDAAKLGLSLTRTESREPVPISPRANKQVSKGSGEFELAYEVTQIGCLHVTLSSVTDGKMFSTVYFGTAEQLARVGRSPQ